MQRMVGDFLVNRDPHAFGVVEWMFVEVFSN